MLKHVTKMIVNTVKQYKREKSITDIRLLTLKKMQELNKTFKEENESLKF